MNWRNSALTLILLPLCAQAQNRVGISVAETAADNSAEAEMASFKLADGYEVNLFASEADGIANPIAIRWDPAGRLWVLTTLAYAQVEPGGKTNDQLLILEDTDRDGRVDKSSVWAENLNMPTGFALGHGGVYLNEGEKFVFLHDTDGDGKADTKKVILSGFGTGDTHQNLNSFSWGPAGDLWFSQGLHNLSRVETPWGIVRGEEAGFFRLRVKDLKLEPFCMHSMASQNPWGMTWDRWGAMFLKSNNTEIGYVSPGIIPTTRYRELMKFAAVGATPGKSMGGEIVESSHLPDDLQNHILIAGYFASRVTAVPLVEDGSGFKQMPVKELLVSGHASFRPVEVRIGPDGAIYVADWFNPIIGHYQASLRHPDRDKTHGRVWRITAKGRPLVEPAKLAEASASDLLVTHLQSKERWVREQARRLLADMPRDEFEAAIDFEPSTEHHALEVTWARESQRFRTSDDSYVRFFLEKMEMPQVRAHAARMIGRWADDLDDPLGLLEIAIRDSHPRVRLEAVVAASHLDSGEAMKIALRALDQPVDRFIDYALGQCVHALADRWLPMVTSGALSFDNPAHLAFAVRNYGGPGASKIVQQLLETSPEDARRDLLLTLAEVGDADALRTAIDGLPTDLELLLTFHRRFVEKQIKPAGDLAAQLDPAMASEDADVRAAAIHLAGVWDVKPFAARIRALAENPDTAANVRQRAFFAMARLEGSKAGEFLSKVASSNPDRQQRRDAADALTILGLPEAATHAARLLADCQSEGEAAAILAPYLSRQGGSDLLAGALASLELSKNAAAWISMSLSSMGRNEPKLIALVNQALGVQAGAPDYSADFVQQLLAEAKNSGNAENGRKVYESPLLNCIACHVIGGKGGVLGPDLSTVGAGLTTDLIIESVLWPNRQLKEGYFSVTVTTKDGRIYNGYREREEGGVLWLRDIATREVVPIQQKEIAERNDVGTLMPAGLTSSLSREDLRDLIRFLSEQRG